MKRVYVHHVNQFCWSALADKGKLQDKFHEKGLEECRDPAAADVIHVLTCGVDKSYQEKVLVEIKELSRKYKQAEIVVGGCMVHTGRSVLSDAAEGMERTSVVSDRMSMGRDDSGSMVTNRMINRSGWYRLMMGCWRIGSAAEQALEVLGGSRRLSNLLAFSYCYSPGLCAVQVGQGCRSSCSYCAERQARGGLVSRRLELVVEDVRAALRMGCRHISIASDDLSAYGMDSGSSFAELLAGLLAIDEDYVLYLENVNPLWLCPAVKRKSDLLGDRRIRYLCVPIQSVDNGILARMRRGYTNEEVAELLGTIRENNRRITINTHLIAGFPGETREIVARTCQWLMSSEVDLAEIFGYTRQAGTDAAGMTDAVPDKELCFRLGWLRRCARRRFLSGRRL